MGYARARFASALVTAAAGAVMAAGAFMFTPDTERWVGFGGGGAVLVAVVIAFAVPRRGTIQRALDAAVVLVCVWSIVCSRAIEAGGAGSSQLAIKWWGISTGAALCGLGVAALLIHEWDLERELRRAREAHPPIRGSRSQRIPVGAVAGLDLVGQNGQADAVSRATR